MPDAVGFGSVNSELSKDFLAEIKISCTASSVFHTTQEWGHDLVVKFQTRDKQLGRLFNISRGTWPPGSPRVP